MRFKQSRCHGIQTEVDQLHSVIRKRNEQVFGLRLQSQWWMTTLKPLAALWNTTAAETNTVQRTEKENIAININGNPSPAKHCINIYHFNLCYFWKRQMVIKQTLHRPMSCGRVKWKHLVHFLDRLTNQQQVCQPVFTQGA